MLCYVACILKGLPGAFEKHAVLGVENRRVARAHTEEGCVEPRDVVEASACLDIGRIIQSLRRLASSEKLLVAEKGYRFSASAEIRPQCSRISGAGKPPGH